MASRTVSLSEDAYQRLARLRRPGESFSDVVRRITPGRSLMELTNVMPKAHAEALARAIEANRGARLKKKRERLGLR